MFRPIIRSALSTNRKIVAGNNNNTNNTFLRSVTVVGNSTSSSSSSSVITVSSRPASSSSSSSSSSAPSISVVHVPSLSTRLHYNKNNTYGIIATPQSHYRRWLSDTKSSTSSASSSSEEEEEDNKEKDSKDSSSSDDDDAVAYEEEEKEESGGEEKSQSVVDIEVEKLKADVADLKNQLLRSYAEQENIRTIARNDVNAAKDFSTKSFAKSLLEVSDNLDRALESVNSSEEQQQTQTQNKTTDSTETLKIFVEGIELTNSGLLKAFKSNGVEAYSDTIGDEFNPDKHQALMEYADPTKTAGTIGVIMKKGYTLNGRVLRPAEVGVIKK